MISEFYINDVEEITESSENLYQIMRNRLVYCNTDITHHEDHVGPPDLCYLSKECKNKSFFGLKSQNVLKQGYYHYVYGLDTSSVAYISAYISKYLAKVNSTTNQFKTVRAIFCIFDYFIEKDLRMLVKLPGGVRSIYYIDGKTPVESETENLQTIFISSLIRSLDASEVNKNSIFLEEIISISSFTFMSQCLSNMMNKGNQQLNKKIIRRRIYREDYSKLEL